MADQLSFDGVDGALARHLSAIG